MPGRSDVLPGDVRTFAYEAGQGMGDRYEPNNSITAATAFSFPGRLEGTIHNRGCRCLRLHWKTAQSQPDPDTARRRILQPDPLRRKGQYQPPIR